MSVSHASRADLLLTGCGGAAHTSGSEYFELEVWFKPPPQRLGTEFLPGSATDRLCVREGKALIKNVFLLTGRGELIHHHFLQFSMTMQCPWVLSIPLTKSQF